MVWMTPGGVVAKVVQVSTGPRVVPRFFVLVVSSKGFQVPLRPRVSVVPMIPEGPEFPDMPMAPMVLFEVVPALAVPLVPEGGSVLWGERSGGFCL